MDKQDRMKQRNMLFGQYEETEETETDRIARDEPSQRE